MRTYTFRAYVGPAWVGQVAEKLAEAGIVGAAGTEHVYFRSAGETSDDACEAALATLRDKHGCDYGLQPRRLAIDLLPNEWKDAASLV